MWLISGVLFVYAIPTANTFAYADARLIMVWNVGSSDPCRRCVIAHHVLYTVNVYVLLIPVHFWLGTPGEVT